LTDFVPLILPPTKSEDRSISRVDNYYLKEWITRKLRDAVVFRSLPLEKLLERLTCACTSSAEEHACADQVAEVIPPARIGKGVDSAITEQAADKAKEDEKAMQEPRKETRWIVS
jgi:hypothetical protein